MRAPNQLGAPNDKAKTLPQNRAVEVSIRFPGRRYPRPQIQSPRDGQTRSRAGDHVMVFYNPEDTDQVEEIFAKPRGR